MSLFSCIFCKLVFKDVSLIGFKFDFFSLLRQVSFHQEASNTRLFLFMMLATLRIIAQMT